MGYLLTVFIFFALVFDSLNIFFYMLVSSLLHEAGHITACIMCGCRPKLKISVFGVCLGNYPTQNLKKAFVIICGPLINLIIILILHRLLRKGFSLDVYILMTVNIVIFLFNMLPVSFMDGGQLLQMFVRDSRILKTADAISLAVLVLAVICFTDNMFYSLLSLCLFTIYLCINKINLRL